MRKVVLSALMGAAVVMASQVSGMTYPEFTYPDIQVDSPEASYDHDSQFFTCGNPFTFLTLSLDELDPGSALMGSATLNAIIDEDGNLLPGQNELYVYENPLPTGPTLTAVPVEYSFFYASVTDFYMDGPCTYLFDFSVISAGGLLGDLFEVGSTGYVNFTDLNDPPFTASFVVPGTMDIHGGGHVPDASSAGLLMGLGCVAVAAVRRRLAARA